MIAGIGPAVYRFIRLALDKPADNDRGWRVRSDRGRANDAIMPEETGSGLLEIRDFDRMLADARRDR